MVNVPGVRAGRNPPAVAEADRTHRDRTAPGHHAIRLVVQTGAEGEYRAARNPYRAGVGCYWAIDRQRLLRVEDTPVVHPSVEA